MRGCGGNGGGCSVPAEMYETKPGACCGGGERGRRCTWVAVGICRGCRGCCRGGGSGGDRTFCCGVIRLWTTSAGAADAKPAAFSEWAAVRSDLCVAAATKAATVVLVCSYCCRWYSWMSRQ